MDLITKIKDLKEIREKTLEKTTRIEANPKEKFKSVKREGKEYYRLKDAANKIKNIYWNPKRINLKGTYKLLQEWIAKGFMNDRVIQEPNKCFINIFSFSIHQLINLISYHLFCRTRCTYPSIF